MCRNGGTVKHKNPVIFTRGFQSFSPSVFQPEARHYVTEIYEDLGRYCNVDGILFHDDGILFDHEDVLPVALSFGLDVWGCLINLKNYNRPSYRLLSGRCFSGLAALDGFTKTLFGSCFALVRTVRVLAHYL
ncbi:MAG: poly-beta-1,6-N-acetyl-D-glucosamine N-deacetylase PgaB [Methylobacter sp.]|nr:poly-beta-1,6-N-acetyl-D-glucosamine N-deacetylase PgaB [Methylobacter sp.]